MIVLGIETSCDETAAAVVTSDGEILSNEVLSQILEHTPYGGVVPEVAARAHLEQTDHIIARALENSGHDLSDIDAIAATAGPGLIGGILVGVMTAKAMAISKHIPFVAVNHLAGHALTVRLSNAEHDQQIEFPYLLLLVSGGHCQLLIVEGPEQFVRLGTTLDDALGEAFDKTAKMLGLGFPGGPNVERTALTGNARRFPLPRPLKGRAGADFSFSGLKTKVRQTIESLPPGALDPQDIADLTASFQLAAGDVLIDRTSNALDMFLDRHPNGGALVVAGGVAANKVLRQRLSTLAHDRDIQFAAPPIHLCTDNAAMIAWAGLERLKLGAIDDMSFKPRPRWPLDESAKTAIGDGIKA